MDAERHIARRYLATRSGQVHVHETAVVPGQPPLWCLHATAYCGRTFGGVQQALTGRRRTVAPDTPGYGASDRPDSPWDIEHYAEAIGEAIVAAGEGPVDLFGYHTGAFLATELAAQRPELVRRLVLVGIPFFEGEARAERRATLGRPHRLDEDLDQFDERWRFFIGNRPTGVSLQQGFAHFVDELRAWPDGWWAHDAAFRYAAERRLPLVGQPVLVLNPANHLAEPSRLAAALMADSQIIDLPHLDAAVLDVAAAELADLTHAYLSSQDGTRSA